MPAGFAQVEDDFLGDEALLLAETKQVNQFFRRFNGEEDLLGNRLSPRDSLYRSPALRQEYLEMLFDKFNPNLSPSLQRRFISSVNDPNRPTYLDFLGGEWFAEVTTTFSYQGKDMPLTLFLELEKADIGSKWVLRQVYFEPWHDLFSEQVPEDVYPAFLHPLSHELDFMNLIKIFRNRENLELYTSRSYQPDYLTLLIYESKRRTLQFKSVNKVKFHFFQVDGWYFELAEIYRRDPNRGWLITSLSRLEAGQKDLLLPYIFRSQ
ncbi:MAG: hypothetical protein D6722_15010 [Bacteroidetes bacterium]|nr:MAG: hypothetical protein D6722_15010 [Bacteroidota bacterium]